MLTIEQISEAIIKSLEGTDMVVQSVFQPYSACIEVTIAGPEGKQKVVTTLSKSL